MTPHIPRRKIAALLVAVSTAFALVLADAAVAGEYKIHDLENIGDTDLLFSTVEFKDSANAPLPIPDSVRLPPQRKAA